VGNSFAVCGISAGGRVCPSGYHSTGVGCDLTGEFCVNPGALCTSDFPNSTQCQRNTGNSFETCDTSCPGGYYEAGPSSGIDCGTPGHPFPGISCVAIKGAFPKGTVFASTGSGLVSAFTQDGFLISQLDTETDSFNTTGSAFSPSGRFFVTDFAADAVSQFTPTGILVGSFGSGYNASPESIVFDSAGDAYVGQADGAHEVLKFDPAGNLLATFAPQVEERGTDWIALAADQCTLFYTFEGVNVKRFNVCTNSQLADFNLAPLPGAEALALKILPSCGVLAALAAPPARHGVPATAARG
jgi:hypothetical protein